VTARITADGDRTIRYSKNRRPTELSFLGWANGKRLVFAPERETVMSGVRKN
jgi:hypothetical protein